MSDPRVFFAAERTLLAWVRSGLTMMAFGFVVARFGLFLGLMPTSNQSAAGAPHFNWISSTLGIALVVLSATVILGALYNHRLYVRTFPSDRGYPAVGPAMAYLVSLGGACLYRHSFGGISGLRVNAVIRVVHNRAQFCLVIPSAGRKVARSFRDWLT